MIEELLPERDNAFPHDNVGYERLREIAGWFGFGASWVAWAVVIKFSKSYLESKNLL